MPLRELGMLAADHAHEVYGICVIGYACGCGWRSPYYELGTSVEWSPSFVHRSEVLEEKLAERWWTPHVLAEIGGRKTSAMIGAAGKVD